MKNLRESLEKLPVLISEKTDSLHLINKAIEVLEEYDKISFQSNQLFKNKENLTTLQNNITSIILKDVEKVSEVPDGKTLEQIKFALRILQTIV